jgi:hypothetical protein
MALKGQCHEIFCFWYFSWRKIEMALKGQCHEIFASGFFHESVSPQPQSIPLGQFQIFSKIHGDM